MKRGVFMLSQALAPAEERVTLTPWGAPQHITKLADGIQSVSTASDGGIKLSFERNEQIPEYMRNDDGWYEKTSSGRRSPSSSPLGPSPMPTARCRIVIRRPTRNSPANAQAWAGRSCVIGS